MNIIETKNVDFYYNKGKAVIEKLNLQVPKGAIYGYLGKNGAGKSTTLKLLLGLLRVSGGDIFIKGENINVLSFDIFKYVGNIIESPALYSHLTCYENLKYIDFFFKKGDKHIGDVLGMVGLFNERDKKVKFFSSGMKQRLAMAIAIFNNPEILILDEPINGLDPVGIYDMRILLSDLHNNGTTILLSSHILGEVEKICTHIGILDAGKLLYQGEVDKIIFNGKREFLVSCSDLERAAFVLIENKISIVNCLNGKLKISVESNSQFNYIIRLLIYSEIDIYNIENLLYGLEDVFMDLTVSTNG